MTAVAKRVLLDPTVVPAALAFGAQAMAGSVGSALLCGLGAKLLTALLNEGRLRSRIQSETRGNRFFLLFDVREELATAQR